MKKIFLLIIVFLFFIQLTFADNDSTISYTRCWENSYLNNEWKCICYSWYVWEDFEDENNLNCIKYDDYEIIYCWKNSYVNSNWKCVCLSWYKWENYYDNNNLDCIKKEENINKYCWKNEYYIYEYSIWKGNCHCKTGYDKTPGSDFCTPTSKYNLTNDDTELLNQFSKVLNQLSETNINKLISLKIEIENILPNLNKNGRNYYLLNEIYIQIDLILTDIEEY